MAFKMKAGKEGPFRKNFPSAFKKDEEDLFATIDKKKADRKYKKAEKKIKKAEKALEEGKHKKAIRKAEKASKKYWKADYYDYNAKTLDEKLGNIDKVAKIQAAAGDKKAQEFLDEGGTKLNK
jgi:HD superfamily phosphohydrolase